MESPNQDAVKHYKKSESSLRRINLESAFGNNTNTNSILQVHPEQLCIRFHVSPIEPRLEAVAHFDDEDTTPVSSENGASLNAESGLELFQSSESLNEWENSVGIQSPDPTVSAPRDPEPTENISGNRNTNPHPPAGHVNFFEEAGKIMLLVIMSAGIFWCTILKYVVEPSVRFLSSRRNHLRLLLILTAVLTLMAAHSWRKANIDEDVPQLREIPLPIKPDDCGYQESKLNTWTFTDYELKDWILRNWEMTRNVLSDLTSSEYFKNHYWSWKRFLFLKRRPNVPDSQGSCVNICRRRFVRKPIKLPWPL